MDFIEITLWTLSEAELHFRSVLPDGWDFSRNFTDSYIELRISDTSDIVVWSNIHLDERLLYIDAFCWLYFRKGKLPESCWTRRGELFNRVPGKPCTVKDVPDLEPGEIQSIVEAAKRR